MHQIELRNISLEYESADSPVTALQDVSFSVEPAEFLCVVGQSGCGKTTMLNVVAGFLKPTKGGILIGGKAVTGKGLDRVIVFPPHPGTVKAQVKIALPRPRDTLSVEFLKYQKEIVHQIVERK